MCLAAYAQLYTYNSKQLKLEFIIKEPQLGQPQDKSIKV